MNAGLSDPLPTKRDHLKFAVAIKNLVVLPEKKNLVMGQTLTCRNQNFVRLVTGHTPWRIDWISTVNGFVLEGLAPPDLEIDCSQISKNNPPFLANQGPFKKNIRAQVLTGTQCPHPSNWLCLASYCCYPLCSQLYWTYRRSWASTIPWRPSSNVGRHRCWNLAIQLRFGRGTVCFSRIILVDECQDFDRLYRKSNSTSHLRHNLAHERAHVHDAHKQAPVIQLPITLHTSTSNYQLSFSSLPRPRPSSPFPIQSLITTPSLHC